MVAGISYAMVCTADESEDLKLLNSVEHQLEVPCSSRLEEGFQL